MIILELKGFKGDEGLLHEPDRREFLSVSWEIRWLGSVVTNHAPAFRPHISNVKHTCCNSQPHLSVEHPFDIEVRNMLLS